MGAPAVSVPPYWTERSTNICSDGMFISCYRSHNGLRTERPITSPPAPCLATAPAGAEGPEECNERRTTRGPRITLRDTLIHGEKRAAVLPWAPRSAPTAPTSSPSISRRRCSFGTYGQAGRRPDRPHRCRVRHGFHHRRQSCRDSRSERRVDDMARSQQLARRTVRQAHRQHDPRRMRRVGVADNRVQRSLPGLDVPECPTRPPTSTTRTLARLGTFRRVARRRHRDCQGDGHDRSTNRLAC